MGANLLLMEISDLEYVLRQVMTSITFTKETPTDVRILSID
jgi:hypothetical protein